MLSKPNAFGVVILVLLCLLLVCFAASVVYADGAAGQWPISDPPPTAGGGGDGTMTLITLNTMLQVIL